MKFTDGHGRRWPPLRADDHKPVMQRERGMNRCMGRRARWIGLEDDARLHQLERRPTAATWRRAGEQVEEAVLAVSASPSTGSLLRQQRGMARRRAREPHAAPSSWYEVLPQAARHRGAMPRPRGRCGRVSAAGSTRGDAEDSQGARHVQPASYRRGLSWRPSTTLTSSPRRSHSSSAPRGR